MFCPACGNQVPDDSAVCPMCANDLSAARQATQVMPPSQPLPQAYAAQPTEPMPLAPGAYQQGAPGAAATPRKSNAGLTMGIVIAIVVLGFVVLGVGGFFAYSAMNGRFATTTSTGTLSGGSETSPGSSTSSLSQSTAAGAASPTDGVDAWFVAVASGDLEAVKKTATADFASAIDAGMFEGRDPGTSYRITGVNVQGDEATVDVQESPSNAPAQTATTVTLNKQADGTWLVSGYIVTATGETPGSFTSSESEPATTQPPAFTKTDAIDTVGTMLSGLKVNGGSLTAARAAATQRFKDANPGWIQRASDFDFRVEDATKKGSVWIVTTSEQWVSGPETGNYTVVVTNGKGYVDRRNGLN